jgi:hypothetical protein
MIVLKCACGQRVQAREEDAGKLMDCSACSEYLIVPSPVTIPLRQEPHQSNQIRSDNLVIVGMIFGFTSWVFSILTEYPVIFIAVFLTGFPTILVIAFMLMCKHHPSMPRLRLLANIGIVTAQLGIAINFVVLIVIEEHKRAWAIHDHVERY